jgi:hypothetical protein
MLDRALPDLKEQDLVLLVANGVSEGRSLEFKRDLPGGTDDEKKEFLADVSSFANAQGGDLIFGIEDTSGVAAALPGIIVSDIDAAILRLESVLRDGTEPRVAARMQWVPFASGGGALVLRVPASLAAPHRIRFKSSSKFWNRNSRGKYEMDVQELRHAFTQSEEMPQRLRTLHDNAVLAAQGVDMPYPIQPEPTAVLSLMPLGLLRERRDLVLSSENTLLPIKTGAFSWLPTLEGLLWYSPPNENGEVGAFALTHRTGRIDSAWTFGGKKKLRNGDEAMLAWSKSFEDGVGEMSHHGLGRLQSYGIEGPWVIMVSVFGFKGASLIPAEHGLSRPAWRDSARLPELILERVTPESLLPIYKAFWLLFGANRPG